MEKWGSEMLELSRAKKKKIKTSISLRENVSALKANVTGRSFIRPGNFDAPDID